MKQDKRNVHFYVDSAPFTTNKTDVETLGKNSIQMCFSELMVFPFEKTVARLENVLFEK